MQGIYRIQNPSIISRGGQAEKPTNADVFKSHVDNKRDKSVVKSAILGFRVKFNKTKVYYNACDYL